MTLFPCSEWKITHPRAFVLMRGVFRFKKPFFLVGCCCWLEPSPFSVWSSRSLSRCLDFLARRYSHIANASPIKIARAPTVPKTAVSMTSRRPIPIWNAQEDTHTHTGWSKPHSSPREFPTKKIINLIDSCRQILNRRWTSILADRILIDDHKNNVTSNKLFSVRARYGATISKLRALIKEKGNDAM